MFCAAWKKSPPKYNLKTRFFLISRRDYLLKKKANKSNFQMNSRFLMIIIILIYRELKTLISDIKPIIDLSFEVFSYYFYFFSNENIIILFILEMRKQYLIIYHLFSQKRAFFLLIILKYRIISHLKNSRSLLYLDKEFSWIHFGNLWIKCFLVVI